MKCFRALQDFCRGDRKIVTRVGEDAPPEDTPAHYMATNIGLHTILSLGNWHRMTENEGALIFPKYGTFRLAVLHHLKSKMEAARPLPRPTQFEALSAWIRAAYDRQRDRSQGRIRKSIRAFQDAHWDAVAKRWRVETLEKAGLYPFKEIKENKDKKENRVEDSDSDDSLIERILEERPPPQNLF